MARRKKDFDDSDLIELLVKLGALVLFVGLFIPGVHNVVFALGTLAVWGLALLLVVGFGFVVFRLVKRKRAYDDDGKIEYYQQNTSTPLTPPPSSTHFDRHPTSTPTVPADSLIDQLRKIDWFQFEKLVALVYVRQGYQVTRRGGANPDGGIDLIIERAGQTKAVQCKQWKTWNVGVKAVREFLGALTDTRIQQGIFITLNGYTGDAKHLAEKHGIEIINATGLQVMMEDLNICNDPVVLEILNDTTKYCPKCERVMVERVAAKGPSRGEKFWGCSGYPKCKYILRV